MSSPFTLNYRRRSHSASSPSPSPAPASAWRPAPKRAHSSHRDAYTLPDAQRYNLDLWRTGKRPRRDFSPPRRTGSSTPSSADSSSSSAPHTPLFPATSADFLLFQGRSLHRGTTAPHKPRSPSSFASSLSDDISESSRSDLARLRSEAFSELQRSVEENGEGFVKRMREFEDSRSRSVQHTGPRGSDRRRRKRYSPSVHITRATGKATISDDDDDVLVLAADVNGVPFHPRQKRSSSLGAMDVCDSQSQGEMDCSGRLSPVSPVSGIPHPFSFTHYPSHIHPNISNHQTTELFHPFSTSPEFTSPLHTNAFIAPLSHSPPDSFIFATSMFTSTSATDDGNRRSFAPIPAPRSPFQASASIPTTASRTEKAIAALTLAMANGAGGLGDYEALRALDVPLADESQVGEMWH